MFRNRIILRRFWTILRRFWTTLRRFWGTLRIKILAWIYLQLWNKNCIFLSFHKLWKIQTSGQTSIWLNDAEPDLAIFCDMKSDQRFSNVLGHEKWPEIFQCLGTWKVTRDFQISWDMKSDQRFSNILWKVTRYLKISFDMKSDQIFSNILWQEKWLKIFNIL